VRFRRDDHRSRPCALPPEDATVAIFFSLEIDTMTRLRTLRAIRVLCGSAIAAAPSLAQTTVRVNLSTSGTQADAASATRGLQISGTGRFVAFDSAADDLVAGDANGSVDVFVRDLFTGETRLVSVATSGHSGSDVSGSPAITPDGRFVAFVSDARDLVAGDANGVRDIFVRDLVAGTTERVSVGPNGAEADGASGFVGPVITPDGRWVVFDSVATNLVAGDTNAVRDVFVRDRQAATTTRVTVATSGEQSNDMTIGAAISSDGRFVAFDSCGSNLVAGDTNGTCDVFVRDLLAGTTERVSVSTSGAQSTTHSGGVSMSADGRYVAFVSLGDTLVAGDTNGKYDLFVRDRQAGTTIRASLGAHGEEPSEHVFPGVISGNGRFVAFETRAGNLVDGDTNAARDVFVRDLETGETTRASLGAAGEQGDFGSTSPSISDDGRFVAFASTATDLVPGDTNGARDVFVRDRLPCASGTVNSSVGSVVDVLRVNGATGVVGTTVGAPVTLRIDAAPAGPSPARYVVWIWPGLPASQSDARLSGASIGCTVDPSPLSPTTGPQPVFCLRAASAPAGCGVARELSAPPNAPFSVVRSQGFLGRASFVFQGILEDAGAATAGFSVTNAVVLRVL
jgi:Tol biopolymer transport system component